VTRLFYAAVFVVLSVYIGLWKMFAADQSSISNALYAVPILLTYTWFSWLFQVFLIGFCAYCTAVDHDHGMMRVVLAQPVSRLLFVAAKYAAISVHAALVTSFFLACHFFWATFYWGLDAGTFRDALQVLLFAFCIVLFAALLSCVTVSCSLFRTSVLGAMITSWAIILGISVIWLSRSSGTSPIFFKYFTFPFTVVVYQFGPETYLREWLAGKTLAGFLTTGTLTPLLIGLPAIVRFVRRDISGN